jgi:hypothetical protein
VLACRSAVPAAAFRVAIARFQLLNDIRAGRQVPEQMTIAVLVVTAGSIDDPKIRIALIQYRD